MTLKELSLLHRDRSGWSCALMLMVVEFLCCAIAGRPISPIPSRPGGSRIPTFANVDFADPVQDLKEGTRTKDGPILERSQLLNRLWHRGGQRRKRRERTWHRLGPLTINRSVWPPVGRTAVWVGVGEAVRHHIAAAAVAGVADARGLAVGACGSRHMGRMCRGMWWIGTRSNWAVLFSIYTLLKLAICLRVAFAV